MFLCRLCDFFQISFALMDFKCLRSIHKIPKVELGQLEYSPGLRFSEVLDISQGPVFCTPDLGNCEGGSTPKLSVSS